MEKNEKNATWAMQKVRSMSGLKSYGITPEGWSALASKFLAMVPSVEVGDWLISKILDEEEELPSPAKLRAVLSQKHKPADEEDSKWKPGDPVWPPAEGKR